MADDDDYKALQKRLNQLLESGGKQSGGSLLAPSGGAIAPDSPVYLHLGKQTAESKKLNAELGKLNMQIKNYKSSGPLDTGLSALKSQKGLLQQQIGLVGGGGKPTTASYQDALGMPLQWDSKQLKEFVNKGILMKVPGFDTNMGMPEVMAMWQKLVDSSVAYSSSGGGAWTPYDIMDSYGHKGQFGTVQKGDWVYDVATGERIKYTGPTSKTTKEKKFDLSSPEDVKVLTTQMLRELLGRAPNEKELAQFRGSINAYEKANPLVTTTTATLTPNLETGEVEASDQQSTTTGGVSDAARASLVSDQETDTKEYGKYQAATTYWDAMMQMIGGGG